MASRACFCFEHILLISSKGLGTSSNNLLVLYDDDVSKCQIQCTCIYSNERGVKIGDPFLGRAACLKTSLSLSLSLSLSDDLPNFLIFCAVSQAKVKNSSINMYKLFDHPKNDIYMYIMYIT